MPIKLLSLCLMFFLSTSVMAEKKLEQLNAKEKATISQYVKANLGLKVSDVAHSDVQNFYEVTTNQGVLYLSSDRQHMFYGNLYSLKSGVVNLTERNKAKHRKSQLTMFEKDMIVFPAKNEKYVVTVFTDPSCGYCRKLHQEIESYNKLGITVRYLAFPRGGLKSATFDQMQQIWCATDQKGALTKAKQGSSLKQDVLSRRCDQTIQKQYELGQALEINGTPAIFLADGRMLPGYYPAQKLLETLSKP